jgi:hypothetical protein
MGGTALGRGVEVGVTAVGGGIEVGGSGVGEEVRVLAEVTTTVIT